MTKGRAAPTSPRGPVERGGGRKCIYTALLLAARARAGAHLRECVAGGAARWAALLVQSACLVRRAEAVEGWLQGGQRQA